MRTVDHSRDAVILEAALDVLAETGYTGMTVDMVAARAKAGKATLYRRWSTKAELVLEALARLPRPPIEEIPDTGSLRGDFAAADRLQYPEDGDRRLRIMAGVMSMLADDERLADAANAVVVEPWVDLNRLLLTRAIGRGEIPATTDVEGLSWVVPAMATYRVAVQRKPIPPEYVAGLIDGVLLPALGLSARDPG
jgi:AcrR family transcriptional regulator